MRRSLVVITCALMLAAPPASACRKHSHNNPPSQNDPRQQRIKPVKKVTRIDMVIALDTSGSMSGLINSARQKLWDIINEAARAKPAPILRVGLLTYGSGGSERDGYVIVQSDLTTNLDKIYSKLFELRTTGGTEYVGRVVYRAVKELNWNRNRRTLRQIFVAGNESADQDRRVRASTAVRLARRKGIFVNSIYCGDQQNSEAHGWRAVASGGRGVFAAIDHNHGTVVVRTPYDAKLNALSNQLNRTYIGYGRQGKKGKEMQAAQDSNAMRTHAGVAAARAKAKASAVYRAEGWDLVDARKSGKLSQIKKADLPAELQGMDRAKLDLKLKKMALKRDKIRKKIQAMSKDREAFVVAEKKRTGKAEDKAFDMAIKRAIRTQAASKKITLQ